MAIRRVHRKIDRTPEQVAELKAERERLQREQPTLNELMEAGWEGPTTIGEAMAKLSSRSRRDDVGE
jgi:hypothetical protein